jgi:hypothetical protein
VHLVGARLHLATLLRNVAYGARLDPRCYRVARVELVDGVEACTSRPMTSRASVEQLLRPVLRWMDNGGDAWVMNLGYWRTRHELMDGGEVFDGPAWEHLSNIDTAMDAYSPDADRNSDQIDELQLRGEVEVAITALRRIGMID